MTKKVKVLESGDTKLLPGEFLEMRVIEEENRKASEEGKQPASYEPVLYRLTDQGKRQDSHPVCGKYCNSKINK